MKTYNDEILMTSSSIYHDVMSSLATRRHIIEVLREAGHPMGCKEIATAISEKYNTPCSWQKVSRNARYINGDTRTYNDDGSWGKVPNIIDIKEVETEEYITVTHERPRTITIDGVEYVSKDQFMVTEQVVKKKVVYSLVED